MEDLPLPLFKKEGDWLNDIILVNPETKIIQFEYPVHLNSPANLENSKGIYFLLAYRDLRSREVEFMDLSAWYAIIIEQLLKAEFTIQDVLDEAAPLFTETSSE